MWCQGVVRCRNVVPGCDQVPLCGVRVWSGAVMWCQGVVAVMWCQGVIRCRYVVSGCSQVP